MAETITRSFPISASPAQIIRVASAPLLAPAYLNFLSRIEMVGAPTGPQSADVYDVWVQYRSLIKTQGRVEHYVDAIRQMVRLRHDGPIVLFEATFSVTAGVVTLVCTYVAKIPLANWLVSKVLDRALAQVANAMDIYAAATPFDLHESAASKLTY